MSNGTAPLAMLKIRDRLATSESTRRPVYNADDSDMAGLRYCDETTTQEKSVSPAINGNGDPMPRAAAPALPLLTSAS